MAGNNRKHLTPIKTLDETPRKQGHAANESSPSTPGLISDISSVPSSAAFSTTSRQPSWGYDEGNSIDVPRAVKILQHMHSADDLEIDDLLHQLEVSPLPDRHDVQLQVLERIGQGTHANVHRGTLNGAIVAIKVANAKTSEPYIKREKEVLDHICNATEDLEYIIEHFHGPLSSGKETLYMELGETDLMQYCMLEAERQKTRSGPVTGIQRWIEIARMLASGISALHEIGIVHGDIKPQNVMLCSGVAKLIDFESAFTPTGPLKCQTDSGHDIIGSNVYAAPELLRMSSPGQSFATDIFALGVTLLVLATAEEPYAHARNGIELIIQCQAGDPLRFSDRKERLTKDIEKLIRGCCAKIPTDRWTIPRVIDELDQLSKST